MRSGRLGAMIGALATPVVRAGRVRYGRGGNNRARVDREKRDVRNRIARESRRVNRRVAT